MTGLSSVSIDGDRPQATQEGGRTLQKDNSCPNPAHSAKIDLAFTSFKDFIVILNLCFLRLDVRCVIGVAGGLLDIIVRVRHNEG